ncbi:MAG: hypothetical protein VKK04_04755, partial [Synechococcales bacterium]|nr:hypothetical protein [Synechococcales bacterium]
GEWFTPSEPDDPVEAASPTLLHQTLPGGDTRRLAFYCVPPSQPLIASGVYEFDIEISDRSGNYSTTHGQIEVLPAGWVTFECASRRQTIPAEDLGRDGGDRAIFPLNFENCSNLTQQLHLQAAEVNQHRCTIRPVAPVDLSPGDAQSLNLEVRRRQPWLGWERRLLIEVAPTLTYPDAGIATDPIHLKPSSQTLDLRVRPLIPLWLQLGGGLLALLLLAWWWWLRPVTRHTAPITAVQILGKESTVLTGSRDQTVYRWDVSDALAWFPHAPRLRDRTRLAAADELGRAVRVIRQSPRDEVQVAIGLENGAIELWDIAREERVRPIADRTDRVFALAFTADAQSLFSGHGSGIVRRWDVQASNQATPEQMLFLNDTAIADLEMLDYDNRSLVAIAGQFNRLVLWDWADETAYTVNYGWDRAFPVAPVIGPYHSLTEVEVSRDGRLLATADNRGFVTLWDGQDFVECTGGSGTPSSLAPSGATPRITTETIPLPCPTSAVRLDQWQVTDNGVAVRAMALSEDGCYLTTATDDGAIALWTLDPQQRIRNPQVEPIVVDTLAGYSPYEIDIKQRDPGHVLIAVDGPDHRARLYQQAVDRSSACSGTAIP